MDGEHAFSAALTLVMVNVSFPFNQRDAAAMETALSVLRGMAEKGNEYIQARLTLLANLRSAIGPRASRNMYGKTEHAPIQNYPIPSQPLTINPAIIANAGPAQLTDFYPPLESSFQPLQEISFNFDGDDDAKLWEEISGNIDIDMDTGWIENALRNEAYQFPPTMHGMGASPTSF